MAYWRHRRTELPGYMPGHDDSREGRRSVDHGSRRGEVTCRSSGRIDPGARIFREVAIEHGVRKLGLTIEPDRVWGTGVALPRAWYEGLSE